MGIQGLLPLLKSTTTPVHIKDYSGKIAAVDTYSWLHKGAITCSKELCQGLPTTKFVDYCMHRVNLLRQHGVKPFLIFDGGLLPMKEEQEIKRARVRKANLERALEHEQSGNTSAAYDCYQKAVDITPQVAFQLVKVLQEEHIPYIVAPFEADAQLAFLSIHGHVDVVITEDSDLIPFGCLKVLFKMDKFGQGVEFQYNDLAKNKDLNLISFTKQMVLEMCILSGCDYLPSLQGMGIKRAHGLIRRFRSYGKVIKHLRYNGVSVPCNYEEMFTRAVFTFRHQWVYHPVLEDLVHLTPLPSDLSQTMDFLGPKLSRKLGQAIARGEVDPISGVPFEVTTNSSDQKTVASFGQRKRQIVLPIQKNSMTNYFLSASVEAKRQFRAPRSHVADKICPEIVNDIQSVSSTSSSIQILDMRRTPKLHCRTSEFSLSLEEEDQMLTFLNSKMACATSPVSVDVDIKESASYGLFNACVSKNGLQKMQGKCVIRSSYFSKSKVAEKSLAYPDTEPSTNDGLSLDLRCLDVQSDELSTDGNELSTARNPHHNDLVNSLELRNSHRGPEGACNVSGLQINHGSKSLDHISAGKKKHIPIFSSKLLGEHILPGKFASDTSHVEHYACIAQKSMERFVSTIAPFRCLAPGARASGLRRPVKSGPNRRVHRLSSKASKSVEDLRQFAFTRSNCRSFVCQEESLPGGIKTVARLNDYLVSEWD